MKSALRKNTLMEIFKTKSRFLSIFLIVAIGIAFFAGVKNTAPDMRSSADIYYKGSNLSHFRLVSTMGFSDNDVEALKGLTGIDVYPGYFSDVMIKSGDQELVARVMSLPEYGKNPDVNQLQLVDGRFPEKADECLVDSGALVTHRSVGDKVEMFSGTDDPLSDTLSVTEYTVVGTFISPMYVDMSARGNTTIGNGNISTIIYVSEENFLTEVYTEVYLTADSLKDLAAYSTEYDEKTDELRAIIEKLGATRESERYDEVIARAEEELAKAEKELEDGKKEAEEKLGDAEKQLEDAKKELEDAEKELNDAEKKIEDGRKELEDSRKQLDEGWEAFEEGQKTFDKEIGDAEKLLEEQENLLNDSEIQYSEGLKKYIQGLLKYNEGLMEYNRALQQVETGKQYLEIMDKLSFIYRLADMFEGVDAPAAASDYYDSEDSSDISDILQGIEDIFDRLPSDEEIGDIINGLPSEDEIQAILNGMPSREEIEALINALPSEEELEEQRKALEEAEAALEAAAAELEAGKKELDDADAELKEARSQLDDGRKQLTEAKHTLAEKKAEGEKQLGDSKAALEDGEKQYSQGLLDIAQGEREYAEGKKQYEEGKAEYEKGLAEFEQAKEDTEKELADAEEKIRDARRELRELSNPKWYVFDRSGNGGYTEYGENADRINNIASVFPVFFILVAALVCLTTMTRMVEEQRSQIGTLKALGYTNGQIIFKFMFYALSATILGALFGALVGQKLFPFAIIKAYAMMYSMSVVHIPTDWLLTGICLIISAAAVMLTVYMSCKNELSEQPAQLMRPKAPRAGKKILLDLLPIWKKVGFNGKVTARNLFRYKRRMFMTVVGIAGCTALTLVGFALENSISDIINKQYSELNAYDGFFAYDSMDETDTENIISVIERNGCKSTKYLQKQLTVRAEGGTYHAYLIVPDDKEEFLKYYVFRNRITHEPYEFEEDRVLIDEKLSTLLGINAGDSMELYQDETDIKSVNVSACVENYPNHYVYMSEGLYETLFGEAPEPNIMAFGGRENALTKEEQDRFAAQLLETDAVLSINFRDDLIITMSTMLEALNSVVAILIICAGALAFVVLYNLTNINITERIREIATLKVMGFYDIEVDGYIFRENLILTFMGIAAGLFGGYFLSQFIIQTAEIDIVMFGRDIKPLSYVFAGAITLAFSIIVAVYMHGHLKKVDMIEALKSVE